MVTRALRKARRAGQTEDASLIEVFALDEPAEPVADTPTTFYTVERTTTAAREVLGDCALCKALAKRDRFERFWFKGGLFIDSLQALRQWWYPVPPAVVRHQDIVREAHKQYSETINKVIFTLLGVATFCWVTTVGSSDHKIPDWECAASSTTEQQFSFWPAKGLRLPMNTDMVKVTISIRELRRSSCKLL